MGVFQAFVFLVTCQFDSSEPLILNMLRILHVNRTLLQSNEETYEKARGLVPEMRKELLLLLEGTPHQGIFMIYIYTFIHIYLEVPS